MPVYFGLTSIPLLVAAFIEYRASRAALPRWHTRLLDLQARWLRELLSLSGAVMVGTFAAALTLQGSTLVLAILVPPEQVALYAVPVVLALNLMSFASSASAFLSPIASQLSGRDDERLRAAVSLSARYAFAFAALTWLGVLLLGPLVLSLWLGTKTLSLTSLATMFAVLITATGGMALAIPGTMLRGALVATGRHWQVACIELGTAALGLVGAVGLTLAEVASATACFTGSLLITLVLRGALLLRMAVLADLLCPRTMVRDWLRVVGVVAVGLAATAAIDVASPAATALHEAIRAGVALACASVACWYLVVIKQHRRVLLSRLKLAS
jgi:O-antigen/teichoic acid export membrane protein